MYKIINLTKGYLCLIDTIDYELISQWKWSFTGGYARRQSKGHTYSMHRQILGLTHCTYPLVDHINGDGLDNRRENLRICTSNQNNGNSRLHRHNTSGYRGVSIQRKKFRSSITINNKQVRLGVFENKEDAALAYNQAAISYFGEFANLNIISKQVNKGKNMNINEYSEYAKSLDANYDNIKTRMLGNDRMYELMHASLGLSGEVGETVDAIKKHIIFGKPLDVENIKEECGDILYYLNILIKACGSSFQEVIDGQDKKLHTRFPNGFSEKSAIERMDKQP